MLKKTERLGRTDFSFYFKIGRRTNTEYFTFIESPLPQFKVAAVVGKKVYKEAVDRNKLKRQIYAKIQSLKTPTSRGVYLVLVKPALSKLTARQKKQVLESELGRLIN